MVWPAQEAWEQLAWEPSLGQDGAQEDLEGPSPLSYKALCSGRWGLG